jgi:fatty acid desaturase
MAKQPSTEYKVKWYRTEVPKNRLKELRTRSDAKGLPQAASFLALLMASGATAFYVQRNFSWPWFVLALLIHGNIAAFLINGIHELSHGTVFKSAALNTFFIRVFSFFGWYNYPLFKASHMLHHQSTLHFPHDSEVVLPLSFSLKDLLLGSLVNPIEFKSRLGQHIRWALNRFSGDWETFLIKDPRYTRAVPNWSRFLIAGHLSITITSLYFGLWVIPVLTSLAPFYGGLLFFLLNNTQHVGLQDHVNDFRLNSRTINVNPFFRYLYWSMNWHIEHHMYAAVPFYNLKKLHREIRHDLPPTPNGLMETWKGIRAIMKRQKTEPSYQFTPALPRSPETGETTA